MNCNQKEKLIFMLALIKDNDKQYISQVLAISNEKSSGILK